MACHCHSLSEPISLPKGIGFEELSRYEKTKAKRAEQRVRSGTPRARRSSSARRGSAFEKLSEEDVFHGFSIGFPSLFDDFGAKLVGFRRIFEVFRGFSRCRDLFCPWRSCFRAQEELERVQLKLTKLLTLPRNQRRLADVLEKHHVAVARRFLGYSAMICLIFQ